MRRTLGFFSSLWVLWASAAWAVDGGLPERSAAEIAAQVDVLYLRRDEPETARALDALLDLGLKAHPNDYGICWRLSRQLFWLADGAAGELKRGLAKRAAGWGERAVDLNPAGPEGHYYAAVSLGVYAQAVGVLTALREGLEGKFLRNVDAAIQMAPQLDQGGPLIAKGRYYYELPWPKRSLKKSEELLRRALSEYPQNLRARYYLAETLLRDGRAQEAKEVLAPIPTAQGPDAPETRRVKALAEPLQMQIEEKLR